MVKHVDRLRLLSIGKHRCHLSLPLLFGLLAVAAAAFPAGASAQSALSRTQWRGVMQLVASPGLGCYHASYPTLAWRAVKCEARSVAPAGPARFTPSPPADTPNIIGGGTAGSGYWAGVSGTISEASGRFTNVSSGITEQGEAEGSGPEVANKFTLQMNSGYMADSSACDGAKNPTLCRAWQQFVYDSNTNTIFVQDWLVGYDQSTCPAGWTSETGGNCRVSSAQVRFGGSPLTAADLADVSMQETATNGGSDEVELYSDGQIAMEDISDAVVDLARVWQQVEFNVYGDNDYSQATFGANTTLDSELELTDDNFEAPFCGSGSFTGETNNLSLTGAPALDNTGSPALLLAETDDTTTKPSCSFTGRTYTATALSASPAAPVTNQPITLTAKITPNPTQSAPTGTVSFDYDGSPLDGCSAEPVELKSSSANSYDATCYTAFGADSSPYALTAVFTPSANSYDETSSGGANLAVTEGSTKTSIATSTASPKAGQSVTYVATVSPAIHGDAAPSGSVEFLDNGSPISGCEAEPVTESVQVTAATCTVTYTEVGKHLIEGEYSGDANFGSSGSKGISVVVPSLVTQRGDTLTIRDALPTDFYANQVYFAWQKGASFGRNVSIKNISNRLAIYPLNSNKKVKFKIYKISGSHGQIRIRTSSYLNGLVLHIRVSKLTLTAALKRYLKAHHRSTITATLKMTTVVTAQTFTETVKVKIKV